MCNLLHNVLPVYFLKITEGKFFLCMALHVQLRTSIHITYVLLGGAILEKKKVDTCHVQ